MIFRQLFDINSSTYTYLVARAKGGEAILIDPVVEKVDRYMQLLEELGLKLAKVIDTHVHADHISGMGELRNRTHCTTVMGKEAPVDVVSMRVEDGDRISVAGIELTAMHTPGHTLDSYSYLMPDRVFTGDTLLIRGTGRTDLDTGDPAAQYESLFAKLLKLAPSTLVYPGHDYKGETVSTIKEEQFWNPRLQVKSKQEYVETMNGLDLEDPRMMDVAVPKNLKIGRGQSNALHPEWSVSAEQAQQLLVSNDWLAVDLREANERKKVGSIADSLHAPYDRLEAYLGERKRLYETAKTTPQKLLFYCAYGERSAMAVERAQKLGLDKSCHLIGGIDAWTKCGGQLEKAERK